MVPVKEIDLDIQAKVLVVCEELSAIESIHHANGGENLIKRKLANALSQFMIDNNLVEFTKQNYSIRDSVVYRARCCLTPDTQMKKIRIHILQGLDKIS